MRLADRLPRIRIPLAGKDADVQLDLQAAVNDVHEEARYDKRLPYAGPAEPALDKAQALWADALLKEKGFRTG